MANWFTSDLHFGHKNIIKYCNRPFETVKEMDEGLVAIWNDTVGPDDTVWFLGDFAFHRNWAHPATLKTFLDTLNGHIEFIPGNHDAHILQALAHCRHKVTLRGPYHETRFEVDGQSKKVVMCHYPIASWNGAYRGTYHFHGHTHGTYRGMGRVLDLGIDNHKEFKFFGLEEALVLCDQNEVDNPRPVTGD